MCIFSMKVNLGLKLKLFDFMLRAMEILFFYDKIQKQIRRNSQKKMEDKSEHWGVTRY